MSDLDRRSQIAEELLQIYYVDHDNRPTLLESMTAPVGDEPSSVGRKFDPLTPMVNNQSWVLGYGQVSSSGKALWQQRSCPTLSAPASGSEVETMVEPFATGFFLPLVMVFLSRMFFDGEKGHPYAVGRNHVLLHLVGVAVGGDQNGDEGAACWSEGPRKGDEGSIVKSSEESSVDSSVALIIVGSFRSMAESALVRVVVASGYDSGGYGVAQADTMAAKVNQWDEICENSYDNSRIYIPNLPPPNCTPPI
ncbi:hypothetical protein NE237_015586 [Protea cynaroides]|uniref:Uncharacterized protein n=1 Tax=Protea cynaroides TaxID=273540 RepID=A0A9Q0KEB8_9MAGN|nr:hypothetical protein NE237_015586 [Protea cynaroides]